MYGSLRVIGVFLETENHPLHTGAATTFLSTLAWKEVMCSAQWATLIPQTGSSSIFWQLLELNSMEGDENQTHDVGWNIQQLGRLLAVQDYWVSHLLRHLHCFWPLLLSLNCSVYMSLTLTGLVRNYGKHQAKRLSVKDLEVTNGSLTEGSSSARNGTIRAWFKTHHKILTYSVSDL